MSEHITLRSYRVAFEMERRLHCIDRFRIPVPYGIPLVAVGYAAGVMLALMVVARMPVVGTLLAVLPWPLRLILLPGLATRALCRRGADGRLGHEVALAYMSFKAGARQLVGLERVPTTDAELGEVAVVVDERSPRYLAGVVRGPCTALLRRPARLELRGRVVALEPVDGAVLREPQEVQLPAGTRMEVAACARR